MVDLICCAVRAAVIMWTSPVLWWQLLSCVHLLCCDGSCCRVDISCAVMATVVVWISPVMQWHLLCEHLWCNEDSCCCANICAMVAAVVVWTCPVLWWQLLLCEHILCCDFICNNSSTSFCLRRSSCTTDLSIHFQPRSPTTIWMHFFFGYPYAVF